jgi:DUF971 family protein
MHGGPDLGAPLTQSNTPRAIDADRERGLIAITWDDGVRTAMTLEDLRRRCPCALCNHRYGDAGERDMERDLTAAQYDLKELKAVGRYAISARWRDGHQTGIYVFERLRAWMTEAPGS